MGERATAAPDPGDSLTGRHYRVAIVGARRGLHHARGYESLEHRAQVVALAEVDEDRRHAAGQRLGPGVHLYANWLEMLDAEQPDVLHVVTNPRIPRADWVEPAAAAGVSVLALEKPVALVPSDAARLYAAADETGLKIAVNLQRRYMPFADELISLLDDKEAGLGDVQFVRASLHGHVTDMYAHLLDLVVLALGGVPPSHVWAAADGRDLDSVSPGPRALMAEFSFRNGARAFYESCPEDGPTFGGRDFTAEYPSGLPSWAPGRCNLDVWAERGRLWWREYGVWGYEVAGRPHFRAPTSFHADDLPAQRAYSAALLDWVEGTPHRCSLSAARAGLDLQLGALRSALSGRRMAFPEAAELTDLEYVELLDSLGPSS
jgi:predicted dehydrogenase